MLFARCSQISTGYNRLTVTQLARNLRIPLLLFCITVAFSWKLVLSRQYTWLDSGDSINQVAPWLQVQAAQWHTGHFPLWDTHVQTGQDLVGQVQTGTLNPLNWILFSMPLSDELDPTLTFPKLRVVGESANVPAAIPVPESAILSCESEAFDATDRVPLTAPLLVGAKFTVNVMLWFGVRVIGNSFNPLTEKLALLKLACEIETVEPPVLVSVSDKLAVLPT